MTEVRSRHALSGTAGGRTGLVNTPASKSAFQKMKVCSMCPVDTGMMGVSDSAVSKPSDWSPPRR